MTARAFVLGILFRGIGFVVLAILARQSLHAHADTFLALLLTVGVVDTWSTLISKFLITPPPHAPSKLEQRADAGASADAGDEPCNELRDDGLPREAFQNGSFVTEDTALALLDPVAAAARIAALERAWEGIEPLYTTSDDDHSSERLAIFYRRDDDGALCFKFDVEVQKQRAARHDLYRSLVTREN